jgi:hypothetical protein
MIRAGARGTLGCNARAESHDVEAMRVIASDQKES